MRNKFILSAVLSLAAVFTSAAFAGEADRFPHKIKFRGEHGKMVDGVRCAMVDVSPTLEVLRGMRRAERDKSLAQALDLTIPVAFHVITNNAGDGAVPLSMLEDQIDVLNASFNEHGFSFSLASVDTTANNAWYTAGIDSNAELQMKQALAIDPATTFNVYVSSPGGGLLGWATFPWFYDEDDARHGVVILNSSLPGGSAFPYDEGDTLTHEAGHYLGLFHTFQGGCRRPGDWLKDTPSERDPTFGCPIGKDTCSGEGLDPIFNFMDYSDDACMDEFTPNQRSLMNWAAGRFKPSLGT